MTKIVPNVVSTMMKKDLVEGSTMTSARVGDSMTKIVPNVVSTMLMKDLVEGSTMTSVPVEGLTMTKDVPAVVMRMRKKPQKEAVKAMSGRRIQCMTVRPLPAISV